jgi:hypothetical protein
MNSVIPKIPGLKPSLILLVILIAIDLVLYYRISVVMGKYVIVWGSVIYPILCFLANTPAVAFQWFTGRLTRETMTYPLSRLAGMAALDQTYLMLSAWPLPVLGGAVANVLSLLSLPMNMTLAALFMRRRYSWAHFVGVLLCIIASIVQVFPSLVSSDPENLSSNNNDGLYVMWVVIMMISALPNAASCVFKESELKSLATLDVWFMNLVIGLFMILFGSLSLPFLCLPGSPSHVPLTKLPAFIMSGVSCAMGNSQAPGDLCAEDVVPAFVVIIAFVIVNTAFSSLSLVVFRDESSAVYGVATAASLGLVSVLLLFPVVAGPASLQPSHIDAGAAVLAIAGALTYQCMPERTADDAGDANADVGLPRNIDVASSEGVVIAILRPSNTSAGSNDNSRLGSNARALDVIIPEVAPTFSHGISAVKREAHEQMPLISKTDSGASQRLRPL